MPHKKAERTTIYDDVFRTMMDATPRLIIYLINEVFGENYNGTEKIIMLKNEHVSGGKKIITDSYMQIGDKHYHIECQSNQDGSMAIRMIEYDFMIALQNAEKTGYHYSMKYPNSCVLYLRHNKETPDCIRVTVELPDKTSFEYEVPIVKVQNYCADDIFEKKLFAFLPYYILQYEKQLPAMEKDAQLRAGLLETYKKIFSKMQELSGNELSGFEVLKLKDWLLSVLEQVARAEDDIREEVCKMCGTIIRTKVDEVYEEGDMHARQSIIVNLHNRGVGLADIADIVQVSTETVKQCLAGVAIPPAK